MDNVQRNCDITYRYTAEVRKFLNKHYVSFCNALAAYTLRF